MILDTAAPRPGYCQRGIVRSCQGNDARQGFSRSSGTAWHPHKVPRHFPSHNNYVVTASEKKLLRTERCSTAVLSLGALVHWGGAVPWCIQPPGACDNGGCDSGACDSGACDSGGCDRGVVTVGYVTGVL